jgi:hypothetical protein
MSLRVHDYGLNGDSKDVDGSMTFFCQSTSIGKMYSEYGVHLKTHHQKVEIHLCPVRFKT